VAVVVNLPQPPKPSQQHNKARDEAGAKLGISARKGEQAAAVVQAIDEMEQAGDKRGVAERLKRKQQDAGGDRKSSAYQNTSLVQNSAQAIPKPEKARKEAARVER
jgi:hypothetical protein